MTSPESEPTQSLAALYKAMEGDDRNPLTSANTFVRGEGPLHAPIMLIGERPGDQEDRQGHPFVGPAGKMLDACLKEAGLDRSRVFLTNAIKRFRFSVAGKRRLHEAPNAGEIHHARWWVGREIALVSPAVVVTLGATALRVVAGRATLGPVRGEILDVQGIPVLPTIHPALLLRRRRSDYAQERASFIHDLARAKAIANERNGQPR